MIWTFLRSCYSFKMRVYVGGVPLIVPARWFWCEAGAKPFPSPHGAEASPWLKNYERNDEWGEMTPYPTDPDADELRGLDRGINPGYAGQSWIGERSWFDDGQLPAGITDPVPPPPMCVECLPPPNATRGGLVLGGSATVFGPGRTHSVGGLVLGGSALAYQQPARSVGGMVLGGSALARPGYRARTAGGLVLGGSATATTGGIATACCPGVLLPNVFCAQFSGDFVGQCSLTYDPANDWWIGSIFICGGSSFVHTQCQEEQWLLVIGSTADGCIMENSSPTFSSCTPFRLVFSPRQLAPGNCCFGLTITVTIVPGPC